MVFWAEFSFLLPLLCIFSMDKRGVQAQNITQKKVRLVVKCSTIYWKSGHTWQSCFSDKLSVENLDSNPFVLTNLTVVRQARKLFKYSFFNKEQPLNGSCFDLATIQDSSGSGILHKTDTMSITSTEHNSNQTKTYITSLDCQKMQISYFDMGIDNDTVGCTLRPRGLQRGCSSYNLELTVQLQVTLQLLGNDTFDVSISTWKQDATVVPLQNCSAVFDESEYQLIVDSSLCSSVKKILVPKKCDVWRWNYYVWRKCSNEVFDEQINHLDPSYDDLVMKNLSYYCLLITNEFNQCLENNGLCKTPAYSTFVFYRNLEDSYNKTCADQNGFNISYSCLKKIYSDPSTNKTYYMNLLDCFTEANSTSDICLLQNKQFLCKALVQYNMKKDCDSFEQVYKFQLIDAGRYQLPDPGCSLQTLNHCKQNLTAAVVVCKGSQDLKFSALTYLAILFCFLVKIF